MPVAFLSKRPNFRLERNSLRRDEVVRKRSFRGAVLRGLPDLGRSQFAEICSVVDLLSWRWKCRATSLADMPAVNIPMALSHAQTSFTSLQADVPSLIFKDFFSSFCAYDKKALELSTV